MPQQVLVIHGGDAFNTYEEYVDALQNKTINLDRAHQKGWKMQLAERLGAGFEVISPSMPCKQNAKYAEWKIWFEKHLPFLRDGVVLVGHSLGGIFLTKYLSENVMPVTIRATLLVAAPFNTPGLHPLADFVCTETLEKFREQAGKIFLYHSTDDDVVPFSNAEHYIVQIGGTTKRIFQDRGHFNDETFPEIEDDIRSFA